MRSERVVRYADSDGLQIAYEVMGDGPLDVVVAFDTGTNIDLIREHPRAARFLDRFAEYGRLIHIDPRGAGLSDPIEHLPALELWAEDVCAVLAAEGSRSAALVGHGNAAQLMMMVAATHPNLASALVSINGYARLRYADDYPLGFPADVVESSLTALGEVWGDGTSLAMINPTLGRANPDWFARGERASATPGRAVRRQRLAFDIDVRPVLPAIAAPTLVIQSTEDRYVRPAHARYLVEHIAGARLFELPGIDHLPQACAEQDALSDVIEEFLTGHPRVPATNRSLMTVAFTDVVDSTRIAAALGDRRWRGLLEIHDAVARQEVGAARGQLVKFTGDGLMATFDGPARAVQCVRAITERMASEGLVVRSGVHTGEVEVRDDDIGGIAVHIAARIASLAAAGETLTSSTVRDLVAGSGLEFEDRGSHPLKGVPDEWRVFAVTGHRR